MALTKKESDILRMACGSIKGINKGKPMGYTARTPKEYDSAVKLLTLLNIRYTEEDYSNSQIPFYIIIKQEIGG